MQKIAYVTVAEFIFPTYANLILKAKFVQWKKVFTQTLTKRKKEHNNINIDLFFLILIYLYSLLREAILIF